MSNLISKFHQWINFAYEKGASDIHLAAHRPPIVRITGSLKRIPDQSEISSQGMKKIIRNLLTDRQWERLRQQKNIDFSFEFKNKIRFRVNAFYQRLGLSLALRLIPSEIRSIDQLNLPHNLKEFCRHQQGFVLITGASSQGKSTTLAALINRINRTQTKHIITLEDPIEYIFEDQRSLIDQREIGHDTIDFPQALRSTLRQDPDVMMVGEMRDLETISTTITAAETGHLVFATLHTNSAAQTIHRLVDVFPGSKQNQIRTQLSSSLLGIVSQRLIPREEKGFIPACEVLVSNAAVANLIRRHDIAQIDMILETSSEKGMQTMNQSLRSLVHRGEISKEKAIAYSLQSQELKQSFKNINNT